jgi:hypothetical protein
MERWRLLRTEYQSMVIDFQWNYLCQLLEKQGVWFEML